MERSGESLRHIEAYSNQHTVIGAKLTTINHKLKNSPRDKNFFDRARI
jgi:hypothetical protein